MKNFIPLFLLLFVSCQNNTSSGSSKSLIEYKSVDGHSLSMDVFYPKKYETKENWPAVIFFHGGHWVGGQKSMMHPVSKKFAAKGFVAFSVQYRLQKEHNATPFEALMDAKSAIRYVRENASEFRIDPNKIIAGGNSAGGHLVAAAASTNKYNHKDDRLSTSCIPDGIILYAAVIDNGPTGYGFERIGDEYLDFSPFHLVKENLPPTLILHGEDDELLSCDRMREYCQLMSGKGNACSLKCYKGVGHRLNGDIYNYSTTMAIKFFSDNLILNSENPPLHDN